MMPVEIDPGINFELARLQAGNSWLQAKRKPRMKANKMNTMPDRPLRPLWFSLLSVLVGGVAGLGCGVSRIDRAVPQSALFG